MLLSGAAQRGRQWLDFREGRTHLEDGGRGPPAFAGFFLPLEVIGQTRPSVCVVRGAGGFVFPEKPRHRRLFSGSCLRPCAFATCFTTPGPTSPASPGAGASLLSPSRLPFPCECPFRFTVEMAGVFLSLLPDAFHAVRTAV